MQNYNTRGSGSTSPKEKHNKIIPILTVWAALFWFIAVVLPIVFGGDSILEWMIVSTFGYLLVSGVIGIPYYISYKTYKG